ncbi:TetR/AcrR family transcriptional regulator [Priestia taiwanensis]|uniref:TetR/AcrR family transcriptional regulator n=1 Tax=Priestia taiwanensis TaxID=1347902 RepID=UPI0016680BBA|nr:TetR/AcrR family transcriptional regulator [Priestia taiwanensis]
MSDTYTDLRIVRTKAAIRDALTELIKEKGFEGVTVKDITMRAMINRGTFYLHYQDKYDLMTKCQQEIMQGMAKVAKSFLSNENVTAETTFAFATSVFEYFNQHAAFMEAVLGPNGDLGFQVKVKEFVKKTIFEGGKYSEMRKEILRVPEEYFVSYVASAHLGIIQQWLQNGRKESPQEMAHILATIAFHGPLFAAGLKE